MVKNRLTKLAAEKAGSERLSELLEGPTALTFVRGDVAMAAKAITTLDRDWDVLDYKGGLVDGEVLAEEQFMAIARLPGREALNAQFAGMVASPLSGLVRGLGSMISGLAIQLQAIADQGLVSGAAPAEEEAPAKEAAAEDAAAEEAPAAEPMAEATSDEDTAAHEAPAESGEAPPPEDEQSESTEAEAVEGETGPTEDSADQTDPAAPGSAAEEAAGSDPEGASTEEAAAEEETSDDSNQEDDQ